MVGVKSVSGMVSMGCLGSSVISWHGQFLVDTLTSVLVNHNEGCLASIFMRSLVELARSIACHGFGSKSSWNHVAGSSSSSSN